MANAYLKKHIKEIVDTQLKDNNPKCTKETFNRLKALGYTEEKAKEMIAAVLTEEIYDVMKNQGIYNQERYEKKLTMLPKYLDKERGEVENYDKIEAAQKPILNENKVGRNDDCPCGSGKKYKKCCGK